MRIQPDDPGGRQAAHQGLAVNEVAAEGTASKPADRFVLAPPPIDLGAEEAVPVARERQPEIVAPAPLGPQEIGDIEEFAAKLAGIPSRLRSLRRLWFQPLRRSLRRRLRAVWAGLCAPATPRIASTVSAPATDTVARADTSAVDEVSEVPSGTRMVQLGAYGSADIARGEWDKLHKRFGEYLGDKTRVIQKAQSGGRTFYRLRVMGFADLSDARRLCSALKAQNADCIPVTAR